jgi:hypothetical protein
MSKEEEQSALGSEDGAGDFSSDFSDDDSPKKKNKPAVKSKAAATKATTPTPGVAKVAKVAAVQAPKTDNTKKETKAATQKPKAPSLKAAAASSITAVASTRVDADDITQGAAVATEAGARKLIAQYLHQQTRPYSAIQVFDNLHKRVPKGTVEKVLQLLATDETAEVRSKEYGKLKLFWSEQANKNIPSEEERAALEDRLESLRAAVESRRLEESQLRGELAELNLNLPDRELERYVRQCRRR